MTTLALSLPRIRRFRRPPKRLILEAIEVLLECAWIFATVNSAIKNRANVWAVVGITIATTYWTIRLVKDYEKFKRTLRAWLAGKTVAPVQRFEWIGLTIIVGYGLWAIPSIVLSR